jgi:hypothetical protein
MSVKHNIPVLYAERPSRAPAFLALLILIIISIIMVSVSDRRQPIASASPSSPRPLRPPTQYTLDSTFPSKLPANVSGLSAIAVVFPSQSNSSIDTNDIELHISQRSTSFPPIFVLNSRGQFLRSYGAGWIASCHGLTADLSVKPSPLWCADMGDHSIKKIGLFPTTNDSSSFSLSTDRFISRETILAIAGTPPNEGSSTQPIQFGTIGEVSPARLRLKSKSGVNCHCHAKRLFGDCIITKRRFDCFC